MESKHDEYVFPEGSLKNLVFRDIEIQCILSEQEMSEISQSKQELDKLLPVLSARSSYQELPQKLRGALIAHKVELQKQALEYVQFLAGKASKLLSHTKFKQAEDLFSLTFDYACKVLTPNRIEVIKIELDLRIAQFHQNAEISLPKLEEVLRKLNANLSNSPSNDTKKAIAIGEFIVAQYYSKIQNFEEASRHLNRSEVLRREYGASEIEFDKIRFLKARIILESNQNDKSEAYSLLHECYEFRKGIELLNANLIPVLEGLLILSQSAGEKAMLLGHLLAIQKSLQFDNFQILHTQLEMLKVMWSVTSEEEWYEVIDELEKRFKAIPVERESTEIGLSYLDFADTRMSNFTPQEWSYVRKQQYCEETFRLICRAQSHLQRTGGLTEERAKKIARLAKECSVLVEALEDPSQYRIKGRALHPEDEVKIMSTAQDIQDSTTIRDLKALSDFSSEVDYTVIDPNDNILTALEFDALAEEDFINPYRLRLAQGGINSEFRDGQSLEEMKNKLIADPGYAREIPPIEIGVLDGRVFSFDTRRLIVHQQAREMNPDVRIRYKKISGAYLEGRVERIYSERAWNGLVTAVRYGGKNSEAEPYINPLFRAQLEQKVEKQFKRFPSERKYADANGFPTLKKQARKLHDFLMEKAQEGSEYSSAILNVTRRIYNQEGEEVAYQFLVAQKTRDFTEEKTQRDAVSIQMLAQRAQKRIESIKASEQQAASSPTESFAPS